MGVQITATLRAASAIFESGSGAKAGAKALTRLAVSAPNPNQGSSQRVSSASGRSTAGASTHTRYQC